MPVVASKLTVASLHVSWHDELCCRFKMQLNNIQFSVVMVFQAVDCASQLLRCSVVLWLVFLCTVTGMLRGLHFQTPPTIEINAFLFANLKLYKNGNKFYVNSIPQNEIKGISWLHRRVLSYR